MKIIANQFIFVNTLKNTIELKFGILTVFLYCKKNNTRVSLNI